MSCVAIPQFFGGFGISAFRCTECSVTRVAVSLKIDTMVNAVPPKYFKVALHVWKASLKAAGTV